MLEWRQIAGNVTQTDIMLPPSEDSARYQFGIALQSDAGFSRGISWAICLFHANSSELCLTYFFY